MLLFATEVYWNSWSQWTTCSVTCGASGFKYRVRSCFGGGVTQGGCQGDVFEKVECAVIPCNKSNLLATLQILICPNTKISSFFRATQPVFAF